MKAIQSLVFLLIVLVLVLAPGTALIGGAISAMLGDRGIAFDILDPLVQSALAGQVISAKPPDFDAGSFFSGETQAALEPWLAERMGRPREIFIRLNNLFDFIVDRSKVPGMLIGRRKILYGQGDLNDWCFHGDTNFVVDWADQIAQAQHNLQDMGKAFVFLISPSKAAIYPEFIPDYCQPPATPRAYDRFILLLRSKAVHVVDGHALAAGAKAEGEWPLFGQYGGHWNDIGQFHALRAVFAELEMQLGRKIGRLDLERVYVDEHPVGDEADAGNLLNLPFALAPVSPHAVFQVAGRGEPANLLLIGTSFLWNPIRLMIDHGLVRHARFHYYFSSVFDYNDGDGVPKPQGIPAVDDLPHALSGVDAVIFEVNEAVLLPANIAKFPAALARSLSAKP